MTIPLYEFQVSIEEDLTVHYPYKVSVNFQGDSDFYDRLIMVSKRDRVLLTGRKAPFMMRLLFGTKNLYYLEQQTNKQTKYLHWSLEGILRNKQDLTFTDNAFAIEFREALLNYLNLFAKDVEQGKL
ncbi:hypothetical protein ACOQFO_00925 [Ureibacillus sp. MALMAid1270]|uniref:hypothetical protein n=1 Tax=Ureibacillus TaxID=160795 RepID=UPI0030CA114D